MTNDIATLKDKYIEYYRQLPVQRYAAMSIGRNEDTIIRWRSEDAEFAERVQDVVFPEGLTYDCVDGFRMVAATGIEPVT